MKTLLKAAVAAVAVAMLAAPGGAVADVTYEATSEKSVEARFDLPSGHDVTIVGTVVGADDSDPASMAGEPSSYACVTVTKGDGTLLRSSCGAAEVWVDPLLRTATASGVIEGIRFDLDFVADSAPDASGSTGLPAETTLSADTSRTGTASVVLLADIFGEAETQGSSWYAETREKVEAAAQAQ